MGGKSVKEIFTLKRDLPATFAKVFFASCFSLNVFWYMQLSKTSQNYLNAPATTQKPSKTTQKPQEFIVCL